MKAHDMLDINRVADDADVNACIRQTHAERSTMSWCGRRIEPFEWTFTDVDHALYNILNQGRILVCPDCKKVLITILRGEQ